MLKINKNNFNLLINYNVLYLSYLINCNNFIIFFNCNNNNISNLSLLNLKNEISKIDYCVSFSLNRKVINKLFSSNFLFLCASNFTIFINNFSNFIKIVKLLNNIKFFFSFKKFFSNIIINNLFEEQINYYQTLKLYHCYLFIILSNFYFSLLFFLILLFNYIN